MVFVPCRKGDADEPGHQHQRESPQPVHIERKGNRNGQQFPVSPKPEQCKNNPQKGGSDHCHPAADRQNGGMALYQEVEAVEERQKGEAQSQQSPENPPLPI